MYYRYIIITTTAILTLLVSVSFATIINIPDDYPTIQAGIDASSDGDTVLVADGIYGGIGNYNISIGGHNLALMSENGAAACIISPGGPNNRCFILFSGLDQSTVVDGFTVYNGTSQNSGAGVYCNQNSSPTIRNCTFIYMVSYNHGGSIYLSSNSNALIENCVFQSSISYESGGAIFCHSNSVDSPKATEGNVVRDVLRPSAFWDSRIIVGNLAMVGLWLSGKHSASG